MRLLALAFMTVSMCCGQPWSSVLDASRAIDWSTAGVTGGIPTNRTTICTTLNAGATLAQINNAIAACTSGQAVKLNAGTYNISDSIVMKSGVTLRGAGMGVTTIHGNAGFSGDGLIGSSPDYDWYLASSTSYGLTTLAKGDTTITTATNHTWSIGDYIHIDQLQDTGGSTVINVTGGEGFNESGSCRTGPTATTSTCRPLGQTVKVTGIPAANQATIDTPLYWTYNKTPQATKVTGWLTGVGIEDLTLDNATSESVSTLHMGGYHESWALRVEMIGVVNYGLFMYGSAKNTVQSCYLHAGQSGSGGGYTIMLYNRATANLFEDNIVTDLGIVVLMDGSVAGNVFAYNYATDMVYGSTAAGTGFGTHAAHPFFNLFEGNQMDTRFRMDFTFGSTSHQTMFRNSVKNETQAGVDTIRNLLDFWAYATSMNVIGNVLGTVGQETIYVEATGAVHETDKVVYAFGEESSFGDRGADGGAALNSVYRQGNWDSVNNAVRWDEDIEDDTRTLPNSFYLASRPPFLAPVLGHR